MEGEVSNLTVSRGTKKLFDFRGEYLLFIGSGVFCAVILFLLAIVFWSTSQAGMPGMSTSLTLENYREVFLARETYRAGLNSLIAAGGTVLEVTRGGFPFGTE